MNSPKITSIDELKLMSQGEIVQFPSFVGNKPIYVRMKRPSLLKLIENGKIPNSLLSAANTLFAGSVSKGTEEDDDFLKDVLQVIDVLAEASFVEPSWKELTESGIELTDEQYMFIFNYTQQGITSLTPIGEIPKDPTNTEDVKAV